MKKHVLITTLFTLLTIASFEASRQSYLYFTNKTRIDLSLLSKAVNNVAKARIEIRADKGNEEETILNNSLEAGYRIALKRFQRKELVKKVRLASKEREKNLEKLEINNDKLISLNGYEVPVVKTFVVASLLNGFSLPVDNQFNVADEKIAKVEKIVESKESNDEVSVKMSSIEKLEPNEEALINELVNNVSLDGIIVDKEKSNQKVGSKNDAKDDEILFFDYSEKKQDQIVKIPAKEISKKPNKEIIKEVVSIANNPLEEEVLSISDAMNLLPKGAKKKIKMNGQNKMPTQLLSQVGQKNNYTDYSQLVQKSLSATKRSDYPTNARLTVRTSLGVIGKGLNKNTTPFQFVSDVSFGEPLSSGSIGAIEIEEMINERVSTIRGTILSSDTFPTIVELPLEYGDFLVNIPLLDRNDLFRKFEGIRGAMLLVELDETTDSIDIDHRYVERILLNDRFKKVEEGDDYRFILYVGVEPGNTLIQYLTLNNEVGEKIVHLVEDHVLYESNTYIQAKKEKIELYETKLLGKNDLELNISGDDIRYFNTGIGAKSIGLNLYEVERPVLPLGMRKYIELRHLGESIFAGYMDNKSIHIPSREYLNYVMDTFKIGSLEDKCLIQVNFSKNIIDLKVASESYKGPIGIEKLYLDKDGMFNTDASDFAKKLFMIGDTSGTINVEVEYSDQSKDYIQTFCSSNTIMIEQL